MSKDESSEGGDAEAAEDMKAPAEEGPEDEEEESEEDEEDEEEEEDYSTKLRSGRTRQSAAASVTTTRQDRKPPARGKRPATKKRRAPPISRGRKKPKTGFGNDYQDIGRMESDSDESYPHPEDPETESAPAIVQKFLYNPGIPWPDLSPFMQHMVEIRIAREFLTLDNKEVSSRRLWGTDVYTSDSDLVAVLHHCGMIDLSQPIPDQYEGVSVYTRISKGRNNYVSTVKNNMKSKKCVNYEGHSIKPDKVIYLSNLGTLEELREMASRMPTDYQRARVKPILNMRKKVLVPMAFLTANLSSELWPVYSLEYLGDKGTEERTYLSSRLKTEVLYVETESERLEISRVAEEMGEKDIFEQGEKVNFSAVSAPLLTKDWKFMSENRLPLDSKWTKPIHKTVDWMEIEWGSELVHVKGVPYGPLRCLKFFPIHP